MQPDELLEDDFDFEETALDGEGWDEETLGLDGAELDADSLAREIGVRP